jgi:hypothetical protein
MPTQCTPSYSVHSSLFSALGDLVGARKAEFVEPRRRLLGVDEPDLAYLAVELQINAMSLLPILCLKPHTWHLIHLVKVPFRPSLPVRPPRLRVRT